MHTVSLPAHFDGEHIVLDAPYSLEPDAKLLITVLPQEDEVHAYWLPLSMQRLTDAYDDLEEEYSVDSIREANPAYEGRGRHPHAVGFLAVVPHRSIPGAIGAISPQRRQRLLKTLSDYLVQHQEPFIQSV